MLDRFTWFRQSAYLWAKDGFALAIDPWNARSDGPVDIILITHAHFDHFQPDEIERLSSDRTKVVAPRSFAADVPGNVVPVEPGDAIEVSGVRIQAVPAYNVAEERLEMHPKANKWVGYLFELDGNTYYHAGDTDHIPELESLRTDVAFVPIGGTYTMDPSEAAGLVKVMSPKLAVPMHYGFVVGEPSDADRFQREAAPVEVRTLEPVDPFEMPGDADHGGDEGAED
jgi:L-ascorbate metabolism protein UlaG (beta-lactamase superfamily)